MSGLRWIFHVGLPNTDDPQVRKMVVWTMLFLNFVMFVGLVIAINLFVNERRVVSHEIRYQRNLCVSQKNGRVRANERNDVIRRYLDRHQIGSVSAAIKDAPPLDCSTGRER